MNLSNKIFSDDLKQRLYVETQKQMRFNSHFSILIWTNEHNDFPLDLAQLGAKITWISTAEYIQKINQKTKEKNLKELKESICFLPFSNFKIPNDSSKNFPYDFIYLGNFINQLTYAAAGYLIEDLMQKLHIGGKIFIFLNGLNNENKKDYPHFKKNVRERFCPFKNEHFPVCLYYERDLNLLLLESGLSVLRSQQLKNGNIEIIAVRI